MHQIRFRPGGAHSAPQISSWMLGVLLLRGGRGRKGRGEGERKGKGKGGEKGGEGEEEKGREGKGTGGNSLWICSPPPGKISKLRHWYTNGQTN